MDEFRTRKDETAFWKLCDELKRGDAVAFIGAGMSARVGYGNWDELIDNLGKAGPDGAERQGAGTSTDRVADILWRAEHYRGEIKPETRYYDLLRSHFAPREVEKPDSATVDPCIESLAKLNFNYLITTNYDSSLEMALTRHPDKKRSLEIIQWTEREELRKLMLSFSSRDKRYLVYLHGRWDRPDSIVLSERDYVERYVTSDADVRKLFAIFSMRPVVFIGFSMTDPDVMSIFRQVNSIHRQPRHFALLSAKKGESVENARARYEIKFGVTPIYYEEEEVKRKSEDGHRRLVSLMEALVRESDPDSASNVGSRARSLERSTPIARVSAVIDRARKWTSLPEFRKSRARLDPEDPQRGRFGGVPERDGRRLSASVTADDGWFHLELRVESTDRAKPLAGQVVFYVHDTFPSERYTVRVFDGRAKLELTSYGAFTVGALADGGCTPLELDLSTLEGAPKKFRER